MIPNPIFGPDDEIDDEDLQYLDPDEQARALGLEPDPRITQVPYDKPATLLQDQIKAPAPPPVPGYLTWRLAEVARARGVVNMQGPHRGKVALMGLHRGTGLAHTTIKRLLAHPEDVDMVASDTLSRLCGFLQCQPGDILVYVPGRRARREPENDHAVANAGRN